MVRPSTVTGSHRRVRCQRTQRLPFLLVAEPYSRRPQDTVFTINGTQSEIEAELLGSLEGCVEFETLNLGARGIGYDESKPDEGRYLLVLVLAVEVSPVHAHTSVEEGVLAA